MKRVGLASMVILSLLLLSAFAWPGNFWSHVRDARPEAILTGTVLLSLASVLRRNSPAKDVR